MTALLTTDQAFERDIPAAERGNVMQMITEAAQCGDDYHREHVRILDRDRIDAINVRAEGILTFNGREFAFIVRDGNWDGTVLEGWEEAGTQKFEPAPRAVWALAPTGVAVADAMATGKAGLLLAKWDALLSQPEVAEIPRKYSYDRYVQPGYVVDRHWHGAAAKRGLVLTDKDSADAIRARLLAAKEPA